ncbi:MAG TPA: ion channel [Stellaceae bacterium]|nr:ion channel [Stellaceae bacterium]
MSRETGDGIVALGLRRALLGDLYHRLLRLSWPAFLFALSTLYVGANVVFALLYLLDRGDIGNARAGDFADALFFSVQTMATIGYGRMFPATLYANLIVTVETIFGLMLLALATGLTFARFSRPTARVMFSRVAVVMPRNGVPTLMLRLANERRNQILEARVAVALVRDEYTAEGELMRRFYDLPLARRQTPIFAMTFTVMHAIEADSPLAGATAASLAADGAEIVVTVSGIDETMAQTVYARTSYLPHEVLWNHRFADIFGWTQERRRMIDYRRFHDTEPLPPPGS